LKLNKASMFLQCEEGPKHSRLWCVAQAASAHILLIYNNLTSNIQIIKKISK
jgi:hypothetical protein